MGEDRFYRKKTILRSLASLFPSYMKHLILADLFALDVLLKAQTTVVLGFLFP